MIQASENFGFLDTVCEFGFVRLVSVHPSRLKAALPFFYSMTTSKIESDRYQTKVRWCPSDVLLYYDAKVLPPKGEDF